MGKDREYEAAAVRFMGGARRVRRAAARSAANCSEPKAPSNRKSQKSSRIGKYLGLIALNFRVRPQILVVLIAPCIAILPSAVNAELAPVEVPVKGVTERHPSNFYVTGSLGVNWPTARVGTGDAGSFTEFSNPGFTTEIGLGYAFMPLRAELTYALEASRL